MKSYPRGIEVLLKKASVDDEFKKILLEKSSDAAKEINLTLEPTETAILNSITPEQLERSISTTKVDPKHRLVFLGKVAALMLITLSTVATSGCATGIRPEPAIKGIRPEHLEINATDETKRDKSGDDIPAPTGIRPDRPE